MNKRPATVTTLLWMVLSLVIWNIIRLIAAIAEWDVLREFSSPPGPAYILVTASLWTLGGLALLRVILLRNIRTPRLVTVAAWGYVAWSWLDRLFLQEPRPNWRFALAATIFLMGIAIYCLSHPRTREYFQPRETNDKKTTHSEPS